MRRTKYHEDEDHRSKMIKKAAENKHQKVLARRQKKLEDIGIGNKKCSCCSEIKDKSRFLRSRYRILLPD
jgi:DNA-binding HxlR family transcriptional regulator